MLSDLEISYNGDLIENVKFKKGLAQRPLWSTLKNLTPDQMVMWSDRFDSLCPVASEWALAQALENSCGVRVSARTQMVRSIFAEINRLVYLTSYLGNVVRGAGLMQAYQQILILREQVFQKQEEITGGRILPQVFKVGGVRRDLALGDLRKVREFLNTWKESWNSWLSLTAEDEILQSRLEDLLPISAETCRKFALWGIVGKSSGLVYDSRIHQPYGGYPYLDLQLSFGFPLLGDGLTRFKMAIFETNLALNLGEQLLNQMVSESAPVAAPKEIKLQDGIFTGTSEATKGPVTAVVEVKGEKVANLKIFTPGQRIWPQIEEFFVGSRAEEFDLLWASLGMSAEESEL